MPRQARFVLPNFPHHVIQRGHNRQAVFLDDSDYLYYLGTLQEWKERLGCKVYGYCLMTNHVHLVIAPGAHPEHLGLLMKRLAGRQTRYVNVREKRTGSLWEGRYKSSPIQEDAYLQACCRYVELNPVRAGLVEDPADYRWSSCAAKVGRIKQPWLDFDPVYRSLGRTIGQRAKNYAAWLKETAPDEELQLIREAAQRGQLTATPRFAQDLSDRIGHCLELRGPGRPKKS